MVNICKYIVNMAWNGWKDGGGAAFEAQHRQPGDHRMTRALNVTRSSLRLLVALSNDGVQDSHPAPKGGADVVLLQPLKTCVCSIKAFTALENIEISLKSHYIYWFTCSFKFFVASSGAEVLTQLHPKRLLRAWSGGGPRSAKTATRRSKAFRL